MVAVARASLALLAIALPANAIIYSVDLQLINGLRSSLGLRSLTMDSRLNGCAHFHALEQYKMGVMTHYSPNGEDWGARIQRCLGYRPGYNGENVAVGYSYDANVFAGWKASPPHYANMVNPNYNAIGFGQEGTYWVQNFAQMSGADGRAGDGWWYVNTNSPSPSPKPSPSPSPRVSPAPVTGTLTRSATVASATGTAAPSPTLDYDPLHPPAETGGVVLDPDRNAYVVPSTMDVNGTTTNGGDGDVSYYAGDEDAIISKEAQNVLAKMSYDDRQAYGNALASGNMNPFIIIESAARKAASVFGFGFACVVAAVLVPLL